MITEETKIQNTDLPQYIKDVLSTCHIFTIADLCKCDITRLMRIRTFGKGRIMVINNYLNDNGFFLTQHKN
jgi:DNA-directed RNA polymerase alpha subunit